MRPTITCIVSHTEPVVDAIHGPGMTCYVTLALSCGHTAKPNPIYTYRVGDRYRCFECGRTNGHQD